MNAQHVPTTQFKAFLPPSSRFQRPRRIIRHTHAYWKGKGADREGDPAKITMLNGTRKDKLYRGRAVGPIEADEGLEAFSGNPKEGRC